MPAFAQVVHYQYCWSLDTFLVRLCFAAKNVILAGVKSVTIHDTADTGIQDLSAQFYLGKADVGRNR